jgi:hypothetical protein
MRTRKEESNGSLMHLASAYKEDIFDGIGDKSRLPLNGRYATFDGIDDYIAAAHLVGDETVVSVQGTVDIVNITISAGRIDVADTGKIWDLILSDGTHYSFSEGSGRLLNNIGSNKNISLFTPCGILVNTDGNSFWHTDGVFGEGSSYSNLIGYSTLSNGVGTGYYSSTFSKNYNSLGLTISGFIQLFSAGNTAAMGASVGTLGMRSAGPATLEILMGGFSSGVSRVQVNTPLRQIKHYSFSIDALGNYQVFIEGILYSEGTLSSPNISFTNFQLYTRSGTTQRLLGNAAQIAYFEGVLNSDEHLELFQKACTNSIETHSRFNNCDIYVKGGDNGLATDYSNNNISFNLVGTNINTAVLDLESLSYKQYQGQVHYPIKVKEHCLTSAGVSMKIAMADLTGVTIISSLGTSTPSIAGNDIELTAGSVYRLELSDGTILGLTEGYGITVYDQSGNENHGTISNPDLDCWDYFQYEYSNNHRGYNSPYLELKFVKDFFVYTQALISAGDDPALNFVAWDDPIPDAIRVVRSGTSVKWLSLDLREVCTLEQGKTYTFSAYCTDYSNLLTTTTSLSSFIGPTINNSSGGKQWFTTIIGDSNAYKSVTFTYNGNNHFIQFGRLGTGSFFCDYYLTDIRITPVSGTMTSPYAAKVPCSLNNHHYDVLGNKLAAPVLGGKYMLPSLEVLFNYYDAPEVYKKSFGLINSSTILKASEIVNQFPEILGADLIKRKGNIEVIERDFNPKNCPATLDYWFTARQGITVDGSNFVTSVVNQGERPLVLDSLVGAQPNFPIYNPTGFLGSPAFEFIGTNAIKGATVSESLDYTSSWFAFVFQDYFPASDNYLIDFQNIMRFMMRRTGSVRIQLSSGGQPVLMPSDTNPHILIFTIDQNANGYILIDSLNEAPITLSNAVTGSPNSAVSIGASTAGGAPCTGLMTDFMWGRGLLPIGWAKGLMTYLAQQNNFTLT